MLHVDAYIEQGEQQRLRRKCAYMQSRQMPCCSLTHSSDSTGWHFAGRPIVVRDVMLVGYVTCGCIYRTRRSAMAQAKVCIHAVSPDALLFSNA